MKSVSPDPEIKSEESEFDFLGEITAFASTAQSFYERLSQQSFNTYIEKRFEAVEKEFNDLEKLVIVPSNNDVQKSQFRDVCDRLSDLSVAEELDVDAIVSLKQERNEIASRIVDSNSVVITKVDSVLDRVSCLESMLLMVFPGLKSYDGNEQQSFQQSTQFDQRLCESLWAKCKPDGLNQMNPDEKQQLVDKARCLWQQLFLVTDTRFKHIQSCVFEIYGKLQAIRNSMNSGEFARWIERFNSDFSLARQILENSSQIAGHAQVYVNQTGQIENVSTEIIKLRSAKSKSKQGNQKLAEKKEQLKILRSNEEYLHSCKEIWKASRVLPELVALYPDTHPLNGTSAQHLKFKCFEMDYSNVVEMKSSSSSSGSTAVMLSCFDLESKQNCVLKVFDLDGDDSRKLFRRSCQILNSLDHPGVIGLQAIAFSFDGVGYQQFELFASGDLRQLLQHPVDRESAVNLIREIGAAVLYVHSMGFIHRDLKPENVLLRANQSPVVCDFDFGDYSEDAPRSLQRFTTLDGLPGTPGYRAPEVMEHGQYTMKSDVFAFGVMVGELLIGRQIPSSEHVKLYLEELSHELSDLLEGMLDPDPDRRLSLTAVLNHPVLKSIYSVVCVRCGNHYELEAGILCSVSHFHCSSCVLLLVDDFIQHASHQDGLRCSVADCLHLFPSGILALSLSEDKFNEYLKAISSTHDQQTEARLNAIFQQRLEVERQTILQLSEEERQISLHVQMVKQLCSLHCPRCNFLENEFTGCFAVGCRLCQCTFCVWCKRDCREEDPELHMQNCRSHPFEAKPLYGDVNQFKLVMTIRRKSEITRYLLSIGSNQSSKVLQSCQQLLDEQMIKINLRN